jgi:hypothetical protein
MSSHNGPKAPAVWTEIRSFVGAEVTISCGSKTNPNTHVSLAQMIHRTVSTISKVQKVPLTYQHSHVLVVLTRAPPTPLQLTARPAMRILSTQAQAVQAQASSVSQVDSSSTMLRRFTVTAEVAVSKIFPAGAGWQTGAVLAGQQGLAGMRGH